MPLTIAIDVMSGDRSPESRLQAAITCQHNHPDINFILVGDEAIIAQSLGEQADNFTILHTDKVVAMDELPTHAIRKRGTSMRVAMNLVQENKAQALVSAGNTGALMGLGVLRLKVMDGIERPAIASFMPCRNRDNDATASSFCLLDMGANVVCKPEMLYEFALMGIALAKTTKKQQQPKVALLNIGEEAFKGHGELHEAAALLQDNPSIDFIGYIEGSKVFQGEADVVVTDGFTGNVVLKSTEGLASMIVSMIREAFTEGALSRCCGIFAKPVLNKLKRRMDSRAYNGACLLGLNGIVVKSHGNADAVAFVAAVERAIEAAKQELPQTIKRLINLQTEPLSADLSKTEISKTDSPKADSIADSGGQMA